MQETVITAILATSEAIIYCTQLSVVFHWPEFLLLNRSWILLREYSSLS